MCEWEQGYIFPGACCCAGEEFPVAFIGPAAAAAFFDAATAWRRVLDLDPLDVDAKVGLARAYFEQRDLIGLGEILEDLEVSGDAPPQLQPMIEFWRSRQSEAVV